MVPPELPRFVAFAGPRRLRAGALAEVAVAMKEASDEGVRDSLLAFDLTTGRVVDVVLQGTPDEVRAWAEGQDAVAPSPTGDATAAQAPRGRGRPRLGVVSKEITLLPRHWAWLSAQRVGASATLRRLVDQARKAGEAKDRVRGAQDVAFRFISAMGGDLPGYEEALRALFASDRERFEANLESWPGDVAQVTKTLAAPAFAGAATTSPSHGDDAYGDATEKGR